MVIFKKVLFLQNIMFLLNLSICYSKQCPFDFWDRKTLFSVVQQSYSHPGRKQALADREYRPLNHFFQSDPNSAPGLVRVLFAYSLEFTAWYKVIKIASKISYKHKPKNKGLDQTGNILELPFEFISVNYNICFALFPNTICFLLIF